MKKQLSEKKENISPIAILATIVVALVVLAGMTGQSGNQAHIPGTVIKTLYTVSTVNVRSCASLNCSVIGTYSPNTSIDITTGPYVGITDMSQLPEWAIFTWSDSSGANVSGYINRNVLSDRETAQDDTTQHFAGNPSVSGTTQSNSSQITADDIAPYLGGVVEVICRKANAFGVEQLNDTGSGSLWAFPDGSFDVVTNEHVIEGNDDCYIYNENVGVYGLNLLGVKSWNQSADEAVIPIVWPSTQLVSDQTKLPPIGKLNYAISSLRYCPSSMPQNSPVVAVGYPAFSAKLGYSPEYGIKNEITTNGTISGYDSSPQKYGLPHSNYYISATIDSGSSGGIALSKDKKGLCLLGIPTWITLTGNFSNVGIVQNINNVTWTTSK